MKAYGIFDLLLQHFMWPLAFVDSADTQYVTLHGDPDQVHVPAEEGEMYVSLSGLLHTDLTFMPQPQSATRFFSLDGALAMIICDMNIFWDWKLPTLSN